MVMAVRLMMASGSGSGSGMPQASRTRSGKWVSSRLTRPLEDPVLGGDGAEMSTKPAADP